jgi:amidase
VSANLCAAAIGTETDGSIVCPSSANGIVGIKPTLGLVSRSGIIPISASQDTAGPMTRSVRDAAIVLQALAGRDERDEATSTIPADLKTDFGAALKAGALKGARVGVLAVGTESQPCPAPLVVFPVRVSSHLTPNICLVLPHGPVP